MYLSYNISLVSHPKLILTDLHVLWLKMIIISIDILIISSFRSSSGRSGEVGEHDVPLINSRGRVGRF